MSVSRFKESSISTGSKKSKTLWDKTSSTIECEILVVGGGGAGHNNNSGGGGAGGLIYIPSYKLIRGSSYSVSIGSGGTGRSLPEGSDYSTASQDGQSTIFGTLTALGGGGGTGWYAGDAGKNGGSGGGGGANPTTTSYSIDQQTLANNGGAPLQPYLSGDSGKYGYGKSGGKGAYVPSGDSGGGGGGGAMGNGADAIWGGSSGEGGIGGIGMQLSITGTSTYYASGGGGGGGGGGQGGNSGDPSRFPQGRGGSNSQPYIQGQDGAANTGNGGGGGDNSKGGNGGSGIVIIAYQDSMPELEVINGNLNMSYSISSRPGYRVYQFLSGSGTVSLPQIQKSYTSSNLLFDFDAADLSYTDGQSIPSSTSLFHRDNSALNLVTSGNLVYRSANGGHIDYGAAVGSMRLLGSFSNPWTNFNNSTSVSLVCWFQSDASSRQVLISRFNDNDTNYTTGIYQYNHIVDPTGDYHHNSGGAISGASGNLNTNSWSANTWTLSVWTYSVSDGIARWYENNGNLITTVSYGTDSGNGLSVSSTATTPIGIGTRSDTFETLKGKIAIARVYNKALSQSEIQTEYNTYKTRFGLT